MPVTQPIGLVIPEDIWAGLSSGELIRSGSVVRDRLGRINAHLKEGPIAKDKNYKYIAIGLGVVAVVALSGLLLVTIKSSKNKKNAELKAPKCVVDFNNAFYSYLEAVRNGSLDIDTITRFISVLNEIKVNHDSGKINIDFSTEQLNTVVNLVYDYTKKLAELNSVELNGLEEPVSASADNAIVILLRYLELQKQIFENLS
jgi:hypothetical protein